MKPQEKVRNEKHYLKSWSYNEGRKLRVILRNIRDGNLKVTKVRQGSEQHETVVETEGEMNI